MRKIHAELSHVYGLDCPIAIVHKATLPEQQIIIGTFEDILEKWESSKVRSQSIIIIGRVLDSHDFADSRLYSPDFHHKFRPPKKRNEIKNL